MASASRALRRPAVLPVPALALRALYGEMSQIVLEGVRMVPARAQAELGYAFRHPDLDFATTTGLIHVPQPPATVERLAHAIAALGPFQLAGLSPLVTVGGSLIAALAVIEGAITSDAGWLAVSVDDRWQLEQWGSDADAELALDNHRADFLAGARFLELLDQ